MVVVMAPSATATGSLRTAVAAIRPIRGEIANGCLAFGFWLPRGSATPPNYSAVSRLALLSKQAEPRTVGAVSQGR